MSSLQIFWDPTGTTVNTIGTNSLLRIMDGDTPYISMSIAPNYTTEEREHMTRNSEQPSIC